MLRKGKEIQMGIGQKIKDHILFGGPNALAGWGLLTLLMFGFSFSNGVLQVDPILFIMVSLAALCTGMGVYALNAYFDREADKINKPNRPIPSGRMTPSYVMKYAIVLIVLGMLIAISVTILFNRLLMTSVWTAFTILGVAYSVPPVKLKSRHILGNLTFGLFVGLVYFVYLVFYPQYAAALPLRYLLPAVLLATITVGGMITMKDFYDTEGDAAAGDITLPVKIGKKKAALVSIILMLIPFALSILTGGSTTIILDNYWTIIFVASFAVYMVLDYVKPRSLLSDPFARVQYYFAILQVTYSMVIGAAFTLPVFIELIDQYVIVILYGVVASAVVYISYKRAGDILKPTIKTTVQ